MKNQFVSKIEEAYESSEIKPESLFLFQLFDFSFSYDDEQKVCTIECPVSEAMLNPIGTIHGGIFSYIADTAIGHLNFRYKDGPFVSLEFKTSFFKTIDSGRIIAKAHYVKDGYKVIFSECIITNEEGDVLCKTNGTFYRVKKK